jgi:putative ABC transport system permease protein
LKQQIAPSRLNPSDFLRIGSVGLRTRRMRAVLSALGIAIGIAAMVAVLGISDSSRADLLSALDRLGTNLLRVTPTGGLMGADAELPAPAEDMVGRIGAVQATSTLTSVDANVYRTDRVPLTQGRGINVGATDSKLLDALSGSMAQGRFLDDVSQGLPVTVLGAVAAERLGIHDVSQQVQVSIGGQWFSVIGILGVLELAPDIDRSVLVGHGAARELLGASASIDTIYLRVDPGDIDEFPSRWQLFPIFHRLEE